MTIDGNDFIYPIYIELNVLIENSQKRPKFKGLKTFLIVILCALERESVNQARDAKPRVCDRSCRFLVVVPVFEFSHKRVGFLQFVQIKTNCSMTYVE